MILTKPLKDIVARMEDGTLKQLLLSLPNDITREDLMSKMDKNNDRVVRDRLAKSF